MYFLKAAKWNFFIQWVLTYTYSNSTCLHGTWKKKKKKGLNYIRSAGTRYGHLQTISGKERKRKKLWFHYLCLIRLFKMDSIISNGGCLYACSNMGGLTLGLIHRYCRVVSSISAEGSPTCDKWKYTKWIPPKMCWGEPHNGLQVTGLIFFN